jgi:hypothetical protein
MIDLRHHIYSLVAVFLALALGIMIGACFIAPGASDSRSVNRRRMEISRLEKTFDSLRAEIAQKQDGISALQSELDNTEQVCKELLPSVVKWRLSRRNAAIIQTGGSDEAVAAARTAIEQAGATVSSSIRLRDELATDGAKAAQAVANLGLVDESGSTPPVKAILTVVADAVTYGGGADMLSTLENCDLLSCSEADGRGCRLVVIVGGAKSSKTDHTESLDAALIDLLKQRRVEVVGCEALGAPVSSIGVYAGKGISTVDNIDKAAGQIGLVYALSGERGHFGWKQTADRSLPKTLERKSY